MITSNIAFYPCIDINETVDFYSRIAGFELVYQNGNSRIFKCGGGYFGFVQYEDVAVYPSRLCLSANCGSVEEVDAEYDRIVKLGGVPLEAPQKHAVFAVYSFFVKDPNGYLLEFQKILDADFF